VVIHLTVPEQSEARSSIEALVRRQGTRLKAATPTGMIAALVAAACMPLAWPLLGGVPEPAKEAVALLGATGGSYISDSLKAVIKRLRGKQGVPPTKAELQEALEQELLAALRSETKQSDALRAEAAALLKWVQAVETALGAASAEVQLALTDAFTQLGGTLGEFRWMLQHTRDTLDVIEGEQARQGAEQRHQTEFLREFRVKINLALRRLDTLTTPAGVPSPSQKTYDDEEEGAPAAPGPCPYKGLEAFQAEDAEWFFGREKLIAELAVRLSESRFLAVIGPSGSGKSSVLRAGLVPAVWTGKVPGQSVWTTIVLTPGARPLEELAARVSAECGVAAGMLLDDWRIDPSRVGLAVRQVLTRAPTGARLLLLVDQFEEIFTDCSHEEQRRAFIRAVAGVASDVTQASVVLGIRADFYAHCAAYPELATLLQDRQVMVGPMSTDEFKEAITAPAAQAGLVLEPGLTETVLGDLAEEPGSLPLLSHALFATWQRRRGRRLTLAGYQAAGGVRQGIAHTAETVFNHLEPVQQEITKDVFLRLTALGEGTEDTRRRVRRDELLAGRDAQAVQLVLERLAEARLLTLGEDTVEVAHEALVRQWPTLRRWLTEDREGLRIHRRLTEAATHWQALGHDPGALYRGGLLVAARELARERETRLNDLERAFLVASGEREHDEFVTARRRSRRLAALGTILVSLSMILVGVSVLLAEERRVARRDLGGPVSISTSVISLAADLVIFLAAVSLLSVLVVRPNLLRMSSSMGRTALSIAAALLGTAALIHGGVSTFVFRQNWLEWVRLAAVVLLAAGCYGVRSKWPRASLLVSLGLLVVSEVLLRNESESTADLLRFLGGWGIALALLLAARHSLAARIAAAAGILLVTVVLILSGVLSTVLTQNVSEQALTRAAERAKIEADLIAQKSNDALAQASFISRVLQVAPPGQEAIQREDAIAVGKFLTLLKSLYSQIDFLAFLNPSGRLVAATPIEKGQAVLATLAGAPSVQASFRERLPAGALEPTLDAGLVALGSDRIMFNDERGEPKVYGAVVAGFFLDRDYLNERIGDDRIDLSIVTANSLLASTLPQTEAKSSVDLADDKQGRRLIHAVFVAGRRPQLQADFQGHPRFITVASVPPDLKGVPPAAMVVSVDASVIEQARSSLFKNLFLVALAIALAAAALALVAARSSLRSRDEIGLLGSSFDEMAGSMADR
jgi:hypothetical protein